MASATVNDMVISTLAAAGSDPAEPGIEHAQVLSTEGASKAALTVNLKRFRAGVSPTAGVKLYIDVYGSNDLANWSVVTASSPADIQYDLSGGQAGQKEKADITIGGWAWIRVRYRLWATNYGGTGVTSSVLLTSTLNVAN